MDGKRYGALLKSRREAAKLSLGDVAEALGVDSDTIGKLEAGRKRPPDIDIVNGIAGIIQDCSVLDQLVAMGFRVSIGGMGPDELSLIQLYQDLSPAGREALLAGGRALIGKFPEEA